MHPGFGFRYSTLLLCSAAALLPAALALGWLAFGGGLLPALALALAAALAVGAFAAGGRRRALDPVAERVSRQAAALSSDCELLQQVAAAHTRTSADAAQAAGSLLQQLELLQPLVDELAAGCAETGRAGGGLSTEVEALTAAADQAARSLARGDAALQRIRQGADRAAQLAVAAEQEAGWGGTAMQASADGIAALCDTLAGAGRTIDELGRQSDAVGRVLRLVNDLADQTDLLALNASLTAGQAGEQAHGFAVIANEIRDLAERTGEAIDEIGHITEDVRLGIRQATRIMQEGAERARREVELARTAREALEQGRTGLRRAAEQATGIVRSSGEQARESQMLTQTLEQGREQLRRLATAAQQQQSAIQRLAEIGRTATDTVGQLRNAALTQQQRCRRIGADGLTQRSETIAVTAAEVANDSRQLWQELIR